MATRLEIAHQPIMNVIRQLETLHLLKERLMLDTVKGFRKIHKERRLKESWVSLIVGTVDGREEREKREIEGGGLL